MLEESKPYKIAGVYHIIKISGVQQNGAQLDIPSKLKHTLLLLEVWPLVGRL